MIVFQVRFTLEVLLCDSSYSGPPLIRPPLWNGKSDLIRGVASREGYVKYTYAEFVPVDRGFIRGVASGEGGHI